ncbi:hypothetical protein NC77_21855 [Janthinobacterium lividum]|nr:hypothetical protein NC77_21855 [Janthinobacterium lividum]
MENFFFVTSNESKRLNSLWELSKSEFRIRICIEIEDLKAREITNHNVSWQIRILYAGKIIFCLVMSSYQVTAF